jgi:(2Fe-2S) ferredoxin
MLEMEPRPRHHDVYVCTNISCSLRGADELYEAMIAAAADDPRVHVRAFECLGACDIAPMASVDGEYVGPLDAADAAEIISDLQAGRPVLEAKQLRYRRCADPGVAEESDEFSAPSGEQADTVGLRDQDVDRPGPTAAIEMPVDDAEGSDQ